MDTAINQQFDKSPKRRVLMGDKTKKAESAQHIIEAPGCAIEISRVAGPEGQQEYWLHLILNTHRDTVDDCEGLHRCRVEVVDSRIDYEDGVKSIPKAGEVHQIAIRVRPVK